MPHTLAVLQGPDPCVCFVNQPGKNNLASPDGHDPQPSEPVFKTGFFYLPNPNTDSKRCSWAEFNGQLGARGVRAAAVEAAGTVWRSYSFRSGARLTSLLGRASSSVTARVKGPSGCLTLQHWQPESYPRAMNKGRKAEFDRHVWIMKGPYR